MFNKVTRVLCCHILELNAGRYETVPDPDALCRMTVGQDSTQSGGGIVLIWKTQQPGYPNDL